MSQDLTLNSIFCNLLIDSYFKMTGKYLLDENISAVDAARWLYEDASFCLVAHNTDKDPKFIYANKAAQRCFEYNLNEFTSINSRQTVEYPNQRERDDLLEAVRIYGVIEGYPLSSTKTHLRLIREINGGFRSDVVVTSFQLFDFERRGIKTA